LDISKIPQNQIQPVFYHFKCNYKTSVNMDMRNLRQGKHYSIHK